MSSTASPQISAARSGGMVRMRSAKSSKPYTHCATRSLSYSSSSMMTLQQAMARAPSVPGRTCSTISQREPSHVTRGSTMMHCAPRFIMSMTEWPKKPSGFDGSGSLPQHTTSSGNVKSGSS